MKTSTQYGKPSIGCHLDHANYNATELSVEIIKFAQAYGYEPDETDKALLVCFEQQWLNEDADQSLYEASEDAIEWLNSQESRSFLYWANEGEAGAFGLWPDVDGAREDVEFVSSKSQDYPSADFAGEWLHVSDHGNVTLYCRDMSGTDHEIWSIV